MRVIAPDGAREAGADNRRMPILAADLDHVIAPEAYVTDGIHLYRVVSPLDWVQDKAYAVLEDCRTLKVRSYSSDDLWAMNLRLVSLTPPAT